MVESPKEQPTNPSPSQGSETAEEQSATKGAYKRGPQKEKKKRRESGLRPGVYHMPNSTSIRLVRPHRYKRGMFEVYEFKDEQLPPELREKVLRQGGWRDSATQWYELVEAADATRYEISRQTKEKNGKCSWEGWARLGNRYIPPRICNSCKKQYRHPKEERTVCDDCIQERWNRICTEIEDFIKNLQETSRLPKGSWKQLEELRSRIDSLEGENLFTKSQISKLRQNLHPSYGILIKRRRQEQEQYKALVAELENNVKTLVEKAFSTEKPHRQTVDQLHRLRSRLRMNLDQKRLGVREFKRLTKELQKASRYEEKKFRGFRKAQKEKINHWTQTEKELKAKTGNIRIGTEHNPDNWKRLLELRDEIKQKARAGDLGKEGRKRLMDMLDRLMDQEGNLREMDREAAKSKRKAKKGTSRKKASELKKQVNSMNIGLGFSQSLWNGLVELQRETIRIKNEGGLTIPAFKEVMTQINQKLDTLKKLKSWGG